MNDGNFDREVTILRTSESGDLARAADALDTAGIPYHVESENEGSMRFPRHVYAIRVDSWYEEAALDAMQGIPTEFEFPHSLGENTAPSARTMASAFIVAFVGAIVILVVAFLWRRYS